MEKVVEKIIEVSSKVGRIQELKKFIILLNVKSMIVLLSLTNWIKKSSLWSYGGLWCSMMFCFVLDEMSNMQSQFYESGNVKNALYLAPLNKWE